MRVAFHVSPEAGPWHLCTNRIKYTHDIETMIPVHTSLIAAGLRYSFLTECIYLFVLESQFPHKIVNLVFAITNSNIKLTVLCGS